MSHLESRGAWFREFRRGGLGSDGFPEARIGRGGLGTEKRGALNGERGEAAGVLACPATG